MAATTATAATDKPAAKKATTKKSTTKSTARKPATRKPAAKKAATKRPATPKRQPLLEREPVVLLEDAGYATVGIVGDVVELAKGLPGRVEKLRDEVVDTAEETPSYVKAAPKMLESSVASARERVQKDLERYLARFERVFDEKAIEGRKLAEELKGDERVAPVIRQTSSTTAQIRGAITSVTKTPQVAAEAAHDQAEIAKQQTKGVLTTTRNSVEAIKTSTKAAATSVRKTGDVALHAAEDQAEVARRKIKGAVTSSKKSAEVITEAVHQD